MASGKQLSFAYGEVSPSLRYKSDAVSYSQGLGKLRNMYVRRAGGVSNRPGLEYVKNAITQLNIPAPGGPMGIKAFTYWAALENEWRTVAYTNFGGSSGVGFAQNDEPTPYYTPIPTLDGPAAGEVKFTLLNDRIFLCPEITRQVLSSPTETIKCNLAITSGLSAPNFMEPTFAQDVYESFDAPWDTEWWGAAPFMPVSYLVTATMKDGRELFVTEIVTTGYNPATWNPNTASGSPVYFPHANLTMNIDLTFLTGLGHKDTKAINLYRGAGAGGIGNTYYKLSNKCLYDGSGSVRFTDNGVEDPALTPPIDTSMLYRDKALRGVVAAAYYQQRLVMAMKPNTTETIKSGDILVSKVGCSRQIAAPLVYSNTGAFQFSIPVNDGTPCIALLAMERLLAFTERGVYVIRGGEQGVLTPTTVNPVSISAEGCSKTVEPKMSGRKGYFINNSHSKLMTVEFGIDVNVKVSEASIFSEHFLNEDIVQLEVIGGEEDTVYLLRRDGKLVRITSSEDDTNGFALMETTGYIESIYRGKAKRPFTRNSTDLVNSEKYYDVLMCYVIRNGYRTLERLNVRDDRHEEGMFFADSYTSFGYRLTDNGNEGYGRLNTAGALLSLNTRINIQTPLSGIWTAGEVIKLRATTSLSSIISDSDDCVVHFFYDELIDGVMQESVLRYHVTNGSQAATGDATFSEEFSGYFDQDVPAVLRDVNAQTLTTLQKKKLQTRCLRAFNGTSLNIGILSHAFALPYSAVAETSTVGVVVVADGVIISSPNNPNKNTLYVDKDAFGDSSVSFGDYYCFGYVGIPYTSEFETLDLEASDNRTLTDSQKLLNAVGVGFHETRGGFFGMQGRSLADMEENYYSEDDVNFSVDTKNYNGHQTIHIPSEWNGPGRINIKQVDPAPMTILAVYPKGISGD